MSAPLEYLPRRAPDLPREPQAKLPRELSLIGRWRWSFLAALFAALVLVALTVRRWRGIDPVGRDDAGRRLPIAAVVIAAATVFAVFGWWPEASREAKAEVASDRLPALVDHDVGRDPAGLGSDGRSAFKCAQCGVVESTRDVGERPESAMSPVGERIAPVMTAVNAAQAVEVTVRMKDGASHLFMAARSANSVDSARWRPGERVIFIDGRNRSDD